MPSNDQPRRDFESLHPLVRAAVRQISERLESEGIPIRIFETYRSPQRQRALFAKGRVTRARPWQSYHQYGLASDFVLFIDGRWSWETGGNLERYWDRLHEIGREFGLEPLSWERPHLQLAATSLERLQSGRYPEGGDETWAENLAAAIADWDGGDTPPPPAVQDRPPLDEAVSVADTDDEAVDVFTLRTPPSATIQPIPERGLTAAVILSAQGCEHLWGVPTCVTLAQYVLESGGGKHMPPGSNNPFGIKARAGEPFVTAMTWEVRNGRSVREPARFRKYASIDEAFTHHARLLATAPAYRLAMSHRDDPAAFANALTGIYATDPQYGAKLVRLIDQLGLRSYDAAMAPVPATPDQPSPTPAFPAPIAIPIALGLRLGAKGENVSALQQALKQAGYGVGAVDGSFGTLTRAALLAFQADNGLPTTGVADTATMTRLNAAPQRPLDRDRLMATEQELREKGSTTMIDAGRTRLLGLVTGVLGALGIGNSMVVNTVGAPPSPLPGAIRPIEDFLNQATSTLAAQPDAAQLQQLARTAGDLLAALRAGSSPELSSLAAQLLKALPPDVAARFPDLSGALRTVTSVAASHGSAPSTIFDLLPAMFAPGTNLEAISGGLATLASSLIPGLGGSVAAVAIGLLARHFANGIATARLEDHRDGTNVNR